MSEVFTPFRANAGRLPPAPTPARATGQVTFGSFNHPVKLSPEAMDAWAELLRRAPDARLLFKYRYYADPVMQRQTQAQFAARGVAPERLVFAGHTTGEDYFRAFQQVDLMLDCWPAPGSTTTLEALSNGVPVLAMVGDPMNLGGFYARTILRGAGLPELAAPTPQAFVETALAFAGDVDALDALRARVRPGFDDGPLSDEAGFTRRLEAAYAQMFERWRAKAPTQHALSSAKVA
jgi:predicted O-linked N-acetylglucosamine transferase (SPINDLY family)